jgi:hypothetical protein
MFTEFTVFNCEHQSNVIVGTCCDSNHLQQSTQCCPTSLCWFTNGPSRESANGSSSFSSLSTPFAEKGYDMREVQNQLFFLAIHDNYSRLKIIQKQPVN